MVKPILTIIISFLLIFTFSCGNNNNDATTGQDSIYTGIIKRNHSVKTPKGLKLTSRNKIPVNYANASDAGMTTLFELAKENKYADKLQFNFYEVHLFKRSNKCTQAGFLVNGIKEYDQTPFDKDSRVGFITLCVAGLTDGVSGIMVVVDDSATLPIIVRYEGEHIVLYYNDRKRFWQTATHSAGNGHPILKSKDSLLDKSDDRFYAVSVNKGSSNNLLDSDEQKGDKLFMLLVK